MISISLNAQNKGSELKQMSTEAEAIIIGKVVDLKSEWNKDKTQIVTDVTVFVDEYLKGSNRQKTIVVSHLGGEVDGVGELYSHTPVFNSDEEVLLFIESNSENKMFLLGGEEGKLVIKNNPGDGVKLVGPNLSLTNVTVQIKSYIAEKNETLINNDIN